MPDYTNGKIYKLFSYDNDLVYIGSTTQKLSERLSKHKGMRNTSSSKILFENSANVKIELIEKFPCDCKEELIKREGYLIREIDCVNKRIENRTEKERYEDNRKEILGKKKEYYEENKAQIKEHQKEYYKENKEEILEHQKEYREQNKAHIKERQGKLYTCECGKTLRFCGKARHEKTKCHIKYCEEQN